jgi:hypothetical protein
MAAAEAARTSKGVPPPCEAASRSFGDADRVTAIGQPLHLRIREGLPTVRPEARFRRKQPGAVCLLPIWNASKRLASQKLEGCFRAEP